MTNLVERRNIAMADPVPAETIQLIRKAYEAGFAEISEMNLYPENIPVAFTSEPTVLPIGEFEHLQVVGKGASATKAIADWKLWLDKCPQTGKQLIWRVPPEFDCWVDFACDALIWKVYARMTIIPKGPEQ